MTVVSCLVLLVFNLTVDSFFHLKVFEDVVEILDPEMNIDSETGEDGIQVKCIGC